MPDRDTDGFDDNFDAVDCCVVGGGPGGAVLALLLARQGVKTMLLEAHQDFERDFRGDTVHPSTQELLDQLGLYERLLELPHATFFDFPTRYPDGTVSAAQSRSSRRNQAIWCGRILCDVELVVPANSGAAFEVRAGQLFTVFGQTIVDLVAFDLHDLSHRFDQARTKSNLGKIFVSTGDVLISKLNRDMLRIVEDGFAEGHHDLQYGMCSRERWLWALRERVATASYLREQEMTADDFPDHGCFENLSAALAPYGIAPVDIPSPFNLFQHMLIDAQTGVMLRSTLRPPGPVPVSLLALMDCLVAVSACPDLAVGGRDIRVRLTSPETGVA